MVKRLFVAVFLTKGIMGVITFGADISSLNESTLIWIPVNWLYIYLHQRNECTQ